MLNYVLVMAAYETQRFLFWKKQVFAFTDTAIIEAESDELADAIARQTSDALTKISGHSYKIVQLKPVNKMRVEREDYQTHMFM